MPTVTIETFWPLVLLVALPVIWWLARHHRAGIARNRVVAAAVLRCLALGAIVLALLRPAMKLHSEDVTVVYVVDVSHSISRHFVNEAIDWIARINAQFEPKHARAVLFGRDAVLVGPEDAAGTISLPAKAPSGQFRDIDYGATNIEAGLLAALSGFTPGLARRAVLLSDGNQTAGNAWRAMLRLREEGVKIFAYRATVAVNNDAWVERIYAPLGARERSETELEVSVYSRKAESAQLDIYLGEHLEVSRQVTLLQGQSRIRSKVRFPGAGVQIVTARITAEGDELPENDSHSEALSVQPQLTVLYVEGGGRDVPYLEDALTAQGIRVTSAAPDIVSANPALLDGKDVVIFSDVRADSLSKEVANRLMAFVRDDGGGLIFAAGENTYGQEGFSKSQIEEVLPVTFEAKRKHEDLDLVVLVDRSSSMRGAKIEVSKSAARATLDVLDPEHRLAVIAFDAKPHDVVPLMKVGDKREAEDLIARMTSNGQTNIYAALLRAQELLTSSESKTKHIILLSDGLTSPPPGISPATTVSNEIEERLRAVREAEIRQRGGSEVKERQSTTTMAARGFPDLVHELTDARITLSTVAIGEKPDVELMANLARWGGGSSYVTRIDAEVPVLFATETRRVLNDSVVEGRFRPLLKVRSPSLDGIDIAKAPELRGYVMTKAKRFSEVLVEVNEDMPLLAETHYGLGKTVAFLSDVKNRWASDWLDWPDYAKFWSQIVRHSARRDSEHKINWTVTREGDESFIELVALGKDGNYRNDLWPEVRVTAPAGRQSRVALRQFAPGRYRARVSLHSAGSEPWRFELVPGQGLSPEEVARAGNREIIYGYPDEYRMRDPNLPLLQALSEQTGGIFEANVEDVFRSQGDSGLITRSLWPYCVAAALLLFLLDIVVRRVPWRWNLTALEASEAK